MTREEGESGSNENDTEIDNLFQNITHEWNEASASNEDQSNQKLKKTEAEKAMQRCRQQAMETFTKTRKKIQR